MRIDQWTPALHRGDAIGDSTLLMRDVFRAWGHEADVYALTTDADAGARPFSAWRPGAAGDVVILHYALPSALTDALKHQPSRRVLIHHNVTPPSFFADYDPELAAICRKALEELPSLAGHVDLALGDSEFNRQALDASGFTRTGVLPILLDFGRYRRPANPVLTRGLSDHCLNLLFVGRVAPNKCHADLIRVAAYFKRFISSSLRLLLVGKLPRRETGAGHPLPRHYFDDLQSMTYEEGFTPEEVVFTDHVAHDELLAYYRSAHVFLSMSEHEGFGVPLVEAMLMDVPIAAFRSTAVADTLGSAGVQFSSKSVPELAELAHQLAIDTDLRGRVLAGQRRRLPAFAPEAIEAVLKAHIGSL